MQTLATPSRKRGCSQIRARYLRAGRPAIPLVFGLLALRCWTQLQSKSARKAALRRMRDSEQPLLSVNWRCAGRGCTSSHELTIHLSSCGCSESLRILGRGPAPTIFALLGQLLNAGAYEKIAAPPNLSLNAPQFKEKSRSNLGIKYLDFA